MLEGLIARDRARKKIRTNDFLVDVNQRIQHRIKYLIRMEPGIQSPEKTLTLGSGFLPGQRLAAGAIALRHLGLAARFVSGYLSPTQARRKIVGRPERNRCGFH